MINSQSCHFTLANSRVHASWICCRQAVISAFINKMHLPFMLATVAVFTGWSSAFVPTQLMLVQSNNKGLASRMFESKNEPRHDVGAPVDIPEAVLKKMQAFQTHQKEAPKLDFATDVRTLVQYNHGFAVISTFSKSDPTYPSGSVVGFAPDEQGRPIFIFSGMSSHTQDILVNPHCSLTVAAKGFKGAADGRVNLIGRCELIRDPDEKAKTKEIYMKKHPNAFWVEFGDFNWFRMEVDKVRFVGGFARAGNVSASEYKSSSPDIVSEFGPAIAQHMNDDHMEATIAIVKASVPTMAKEVDSDDEPPEITEALITSVDSLGMFVKVTRNAPSAFLPESFKVRVPFPRPAESRKDVKVLIMELTQKAASVSKA